MQNYDTVKFLIHNYDAGTTGWVHCEVRSPTQLQQNLMGEKQGGALLFSHSGSPPVEGSLEHRDKCFSLWSGCVMATVTSNLSSEKLNVGLLHQILYI